MTPDLPTRFLPHWAELRDATNAARLDGGYDKDVFRIDADGEPYALRVYQREVPADAVASELALLAPFAAQLDEVPNTIPTRDGALFAVEGGRIAVLTPFVEGQTPDRRNPQHRRAAAETLARLHEVGASIEHSAPRPDFPARRDLDWQSNRWWSWPDVERFLDEHHLPGLADTDAAGLHRRLIGEMAVLEGTFDRPSRLGLPSMPLHNDFWEGNLVERDGRIVGIVDWDECMVDWRAIEVVDAACSFGRLDNDHELDPASACEFLALYERAGGEILPEERQAFFLLRKVRLLWETLYELGRACRGLPLDDEAYLWLNLTSLDSFGDDLFIA
jgi:Ser/Thr protein kinase RdoA (MazF antagonist)